MTLLQVDDSGWGFPISGVMVGVSDGQRVETDLVPVEYFCPSAMASKSYQYEFAARALKIITSKFHATPTTHNLFVCRGYVLDVFYLTTKHLGYQVERGPVTGLLQSEIEKRWHTHITELTQGAVQCYDPKDIPKKDIPKLYYRALNWGLQNPQWLKTGWRSIQAKMFATKEVNHV